MAASEQSPRLSTAEKIAEEDAAAFYQDLQREDMLGVVIRGAIHIENQLNGIIEENLVAPSELKDMRLGYADRISLAVALGVSADFKPPLKALGTIRNNFAHRLDIEISDAQAKGLYDAFKPDDKSKIQQIYDRTNVRLGKPRPRKFANSDPKDRVIFCIIVLRGALIVARAQARRTRDNG